MELLWIRYGHGTYKYVLLVCLGTWEKYTIGLDQAAIDPTEFDRLRAATRNMGDSDLKERTGMVKLLCPRSYSSAYRKLSNDKIKVISRHPIK